MPSRQPSPLERSPSSSRRSNEEASIGEVVRAVPRDVVRRGHRRRRRQQRRARSSARRAAGADVIDAGRGYGRACLRRRRRRADDADIIVFMDGDGADDPRAIAALVAPIRAGRLRFRHRLARARRARARQHAPGTRSLAGRARRLRHAAPLRRALHRHVRRSAPSAAMRCCALGMREMTYGWNLEMQMRAARAGLRILEVPVAYRRRSGGSLEGRRQPARHPAGRRPHRRDLRPGGGAAYAAPAARDRLAQGGGRAAARPLRPARARARAGARPRRLRRADAGKDAARHRPALAGAHRHPRQCLRRALGPVVCADRPRRALRRDLGARRRPHRRSSAEEDHRRRHRAPGGAQQPGPGRQP